MFFVIASGEKDADARPADRTTAAAGFIGLPSASGVLRILDHCHRKMFYALGDAYGDRAPISSTNRQLWAEDAGPTARRQAAGDADEGLGRF